MWDAYRTGEWYTSADGSAGTVRAAAVRHLLLTRPAPQPGRQPALRLRGLVVDGPLDLGDCALEVVVAFDRCVFEEPLVLDGATAVAVRLTGCQLAGLRADRLTTTHGLSVAQSSVNGCVYLRDARIGGQLDLTASTITPTGYLPGRPPAIDGRTPDQYVGIDAENITVGGDLGAAGVVWRGGLFLNLARVNGAVILNGATCPDGFLHAPSLVAGGVYARDGFRLEGLLNLPYAEVNGPIELSGARIANPGEVAFGGFGIRVSGSLTAGADTELAGTVDLQGADIRGGLHLAGLSVTDPGPDGSLHLFRAAVGGGVELTGARLSGDFRLRYARITAGLHFVDGSVDGRVDADNLVLTGDFDLTDTALTGEVTLRGARVEDTVDLERTRFGSTGGVSLQADGLTCFQLGLMCHTPPGDVHLGHATVEVLCDTAQAWPDGPGRPHLTDFTYRRLRQDVPMAARLDLLARATPSGQPQPYEQLAAVFRSAGREREAQRVLREKLRRESRSGGLVRRAWGRVQDLTIGYGYLPARAAVIFAALLAAGTAYFAAAADCVGRAGPCPVQPGQHPHWDPFLYTLDLLIPLVDLGHEKAWDVTGIDKVVMVTLLLSGWIFATTIIAAAGRAIRRP
ncbi:hypothetical protein AB0B66_25330 [Catellatospora sp. NPDC049111]|uniref:hypothetical protein n=1 Tax=Catellatospora sp. NPDC049111 TaxID=3155271 RepID=UPI0033EE41E0